MTEKAPLIGGRFGAELGGAYAERLPSRMNGLVRRMIGRRPHAVGGRGPEVGRVSSGSPRRKTRRAVTKEREGERQPWEKNDHSKKTSSHHG